MIWKFAPEAAERAAGFRFHPDQVLEAQADGSLIVRFHAAGWLEMAWHLYQWGDKVEVLAPRACATMSIPGGGRIWMACRDDPPSPEHPFMI